MSTDPRLAASTPFSGSTREHQVALFVAEASRVLASSLDYATTLATVTRLAVPVFADFCAVHVLTQAGELELVSLAHAAPARVEAALLLTRRCPVDRTSPWGYAEVLRTGKPAFVRDLSQVARGFPPLQPGQLAAALDLGLRSIILQPLQARGRTFGVLALALAESGRTYTDADLEVAVEVAQRAAMAVDNARLYRESMADLRLQEEFVAVASHEIRTPLTTLKLQLHALKRLASRDGPDGGAHGLARLEAVESQVAQLERLVDDLLVVARRSAGRLVLDLSSVDLTALALDVIERLAFDAARANASVRLDAPGPVLGRWDRRLLEQIATNLLTNAIKYGNGGLIEVSVEAEGPVARLVVRDHGSGVALEDYARIFERFERSDPSGRTPGTGLGLWIVREFVGALGGKVRVRAADGGGSAFVVELPRDLAPTG